MGAKVSVLGLIMSYPPYLSSAMVGFPLQYLHPTSCVTLIKPNLKHKKYIQKNVLAKAHKFTQKLAAPVLFCVRLLAQKAYTNNHH